MATIIKQQTNRQETSGTTVRPVSFSFAEMSGRADGFLASVKDQAAAIIADAHKDAERVRQLAERAGRKAAEEAIDKILEQRVADKMKSLTPAIDQVVAELRDARGEWQNHWERAAVKLATAIAERIIRGQVAQRPEITLQFVREALEMAVSASDVTVHLHPDDYDHLGNQVDTLAESICSLASTRIVADSEVSPGGCRVVTRHGEIDQQIESQLRRIEEDLS